MKYRIDILPKARKEMERLPRHSGQRVTSAILRLAENPRPHGCRKLVGSDDLFRIRSGQYRIIYQVQDEVLLVVVVKVGHRQGVYRDM